LIVVSFDPLQSMDDVTAQRPSFNDPERDARLLKEANQTTR
jgi:phage terminase large subunit-like protein